MDALYKTGHRGRTFDLPFPTILWSFHVRRSTSSSGTSLRTVLPVCISPSPSNKIDCQILRNGIGIWFARAYCDTISLLRPWRIPHCGTCSPCVRELCSLHAYAYCGCSHWKTSSGNQARGTAIGSKICHSWLRVRYWTKARGFCTDMC